MLRAVLQRGRPSPIFSSLLSSRKTLVSRFSSNVAAAASSSTGSTVSYEVTKDGIAVVKIDDPSEKVNVLSEKVFADFEVVFNKIQADNNVKASVLISGKKDNFIAGADINMLSANSDSSAKLTQLSTNGQKMLNQIASGKPVVAAINGSCLGGGLEVALACHYRIATESPKTSLGLPEVKLGLLPGAGGTQRLIRLVDIPTSLDMLLTGKNIYPKKAKKMNLVDQVADPYALEEAALQAARNLASGALKPKRVENFMNRTIRYLVTTVPFVRNYFFDKARETVQKQTNGKYPAPFAILNVVKTGLEKGVEQGLQAEALEFGRLGVTDESKSLIHIFNTSNQCKKNRFGKPQKPVGTIAVLGAGLMGAGITQVSIEKGYRVLLKDLNFEGIARGEKQIIKNLNTQVKKKQITQFKRDQVLAKIVPLTEDAAYGDWRQHFQKADMVIEAVFEDLALKHKVIKSIEEHLSSDAIFATNTSALPIAEIAKASKRPENVIGMHYFSPVEKMPLLEIITHEGTSNETAARTVEVGLKQGKYVIVVKDVPGFYVNRSLGPYMDETSALLKDGVEPKKLDDAMRQFGFPVGPVSLADEVGIDVAAHVQSFLSSHLGVRMTGGDPSALKEMMSMKVLGRKSGKGFYVYDDVKKGSKNKSKEINPAMAEILTKFRGSRAALNLSTEDIQMRMVTRFINEAVYCLQDKIIASPGDGDIGLVFGVGFPPFLGGPFRYIDTFGAQRMVDQMNKYRDQYGEHFAPAPMLEEYAKSGKKFHST